MKQLQIKNLTICGDPTDTTGVICIDFTKNEAGLSQIMMNQSDWTDLSEHVEEFFMLTSQHKAGGGTKKPKKVKKK